MVDTRVAELALELTTTPADADIFMIVDVDDTTHHATGTSKKITYANALRSVTNPIESDISDLTTVVSGKANTVHTHAITDITGLQTALDAKADTQRINTFSVNIATPSTLYSQVINSTGITPNDFILLTHGDYLDTDHNSIDFLDLLNASTFCETDKFTLNLQFKYPTVGIIKLKWRKI